MSQSSSNASEQRSLIVRDIQTKGPAFNFQKIHDIKNPKLYKPNTKQLGIDYSKQLQIESEKFYAQIKDLPDSFEKKGLTFNKKSLIYSKERELRKIAKEPYIDKCHMPKKQQMRDSSAKRSGSNIFRQKDSEISKLHTNIKLKKENIFHGNLNYGKFNDVLKSGTGVDLKKSSISNFSIGDAPAKPHRDPILIAKLKEVINHIQREYPEVFYPTDITARKCTDTSKRQNLKQQLIRNIQMIGIEEVDPLKYAQKYSQELINSSKLPDLDITIWLEALNNQLLGY